MLSWKRADLAAALSAPVARRARRIAGRAGDPCVESARPMACALGRRAWPLARRRQPCRTCATHRPKRPVAGARLVASQGLAARQSWHDMRACGIGRHGDRHCRDHRLAIGSDRCHEAGRDGECCRLHRDISWRFAIDRRQLYWRCRPFPHQPRMAPMWRSSFRRSASSSRAACRRPRWGCIRCSPAISMW